jgi:hypothetical protein
MSSLQKFHRRTNAKSNTLHTGTVTISGNPWVNKILTATNTIADVDGLGTFAYQWKRSGSAISGATGTTYTLVSADVGNTITVTITYTDGKGFIETETSAATASVVNNTLHTGTVSISGTAEEGSVLTASNNIADADGLGTFAYQWKRSGSAISGATSTTYTLVSADVGNTITVTITYTDGKGFIETATSAATASVITPPPFPVIGAGNNTVGYWLGDVSTNKLIVAPKSTEVQRAWGSRGTARNTISTTDGLANTNTLAGFGQSAHPAAYYCKYLTTGGYNTWYLPATGELTAVYNNKGQSPFAISNGLVNNDYWTSTEFDSTSAFAKGGSNGSLYTDNKTSGIYAVRAVRRTTI